MTSSTADREIVLSRTVDAPRDLVWQVWTTPEHLAHWWGPNGFTITTHEFDFRVGGVWDFIMHGPDGRDYQNHVVFTDIKEPELMAHDHGDGEGQIHFQATISFEDAGDGKTTVTMHSLFPSAEERDYVIKEHGAIEGGKQTLGRLADYVMTMAK